MLPSGKPNGLRLIMKRFLPLFFPLVGVLFVGCQASKKSENDGVVSQRYIHKYGYDVSREEWELKGCPGQVITTLRGGMTITSSYENGLLHGPTMCTFPHSNTRESLSIYERGNLIKKTVYSVRGIPRIEHDFSSPSRVKVTRWYNQGVPLCVEEYHDNRLVDGEYYDEHNRPECCVVKGMGFRIIRDQYEQAVAKETIEDGYPTLRESFHLNGIPHVVTPLCDGRVDGVKKVFASTGEPLLCESYKQDVLHGLATYFQNGSRYLEINYKNGLKHGFERHFIDGEVLVEETEWVDGQRHGPSTVFFDGTSTTRYYYNNIFVTKERYRKLCEQTENITIMNDRIMGRN